MESGEAGPARCFSTFLCMPNITVFTIVTTITASISTTIIIIIITVTINSIAITMRSVQGSGFRCSGSGG